MSGPCGSNIGLPGMNEEPNTIRLAFVGDICLGLELKEKVGASDSDRIFAGVSKQLAEADLRVGNLECCLVDAHVDETVRKNPMAAPIELARCIKDAGFEVLGLANNHILDCGEASFNTALDSCRRSNVKTFGAGRDLAEALRPAIVDVHGRRLAFLGFGDTEWYYAGVNRPGIAPLESDMVLRAIDAARQDADLVIVTLHADLEFGFHPSTWRVRMARAIGERGADMVVQHHPHVLQGIERHGNSLIAYSLGNFVFHWFGNEYLGEKPGINESAILYVTADFSGATVRLSYEAVPIAIDRAGLPQVPAPEQAAKIARHLASVSQSLADPALVRRNWHARCREEFRYQRGSLYWTLRDHGPSIFIRRLIRMLKRKDHRRWIKGLLTFGRS